MPAKWFILKDDSAGADLITPLKAAMHSTTAAKITGDVVQSVRTCDYDATLQMVKADIADAERIGSLAALARDQEGIGIFVMEIVDIDDHQERAFCQLGEKHPTTGAIVTDLYVKSPHTQASKGALPVAQVSGTTGRNFQDALTWDKYRDLIGLPTQNVHVWFLDQCFLAWMSGDSFDSNTSIDMTEGASAASPNRYRFDYPDHPACRYGGHLFGNGVTWTDEGDSATTGTGHVWSITLPLTCFGSAIFIDPVTKGFCDYDRVIDRQDSEANMNANPWSHWASSYMSGNTFKIHLPLGENPANRIRVQATNATAGCHLRFTGTHPKFIEIYAARGACNVDTFVSGTAVPDGVKYLKGRQDASLSTYQNWAYYNKGTSGRGGSSTTKDGLGFDMQGTSPSTALTGPTIEGAYFEQCSLGLFFNRLAENVGRMDGWTITTGLRGVDIGGHILEYFNSDGHLLAMQGDAAGLFMRGEFTAIRCGGPMALYAGNNHNASINFHEEASFDNLDIDVDITIQGHSTHWPFGGNSSDVGVHLACDPDAIPSAANAQIVLAGTIEGMRYGIRTQWPAHVPIRARTQDALVISKGTYPNSDGAAFATSRSTATRKVTLSGATGTWSPGDLLEDPDTPNFITGIVLEVTGAAATPTIHFYRGGTWGTTATYVDADTVNNITSGATGTANGAEAAGDTTLTGSMDVDGIKCAADLDKITNYASSAAPGGNLDTRAGIGWRHRSVNITVVGQPTTGHFVSPTHGTQDYPGFQGNVAAGNTYLGGSSTNPAS